jgi:glyceraldehyde 3-phosphate dehydrogenase
MTAPQTSDKKIKIAINGFGRIGRSAFKIANENPAVEVIAINDLSNPRVLAHLLKYDTAYGIYPRDVSIDEDGGIVELTDYRGDKDFYTKTGKKNHLVVDDKRTLIFSEKEPDKLPWKNLEVDVVLECTGRFVEDDSAGKHITAGAKRVIVSAPTKGGTAETFLLGANQDTYTGQEIISNASCTTNCISPVAHIINKEFKIIKAALTTIHGVTAGQNTVDGPPNPLKPDLRRARAAGWNLIPTTTGAATATTKVIPELEGLFDGIAIRAPIITGSISDLTFLVEKKTTVEEVNGAFIRAMKNPFYDKVLAVTYEPIVSSDIIGSSFSAIVDLTLTKVIDGDLVKVLAWYDNEWGYSNRLVEMAVLAGNSI